MIAALAEAGAVLGRDDYLDAARGLRRVRARRRCATPTGACCAPTRTASAHLNAYLEDHAFLVEALLTLYEATLRAALVRRGARARRHDDRALRRPRARRLLHDLRRPRGADRPPQGHRRPPDPVRQLLRGARAAAARGADRRARATSSGPIGVLRLFARGRRSPPRGLRPPAAGARLPPRADPRGGAGRARDGDGLDELAAVVRSAFRPHLVLAGGPEGTERPGADAGAGRRSRAARPPTSARTSPAGCRSPTRAELEAAARRWRRLATKAPEKTAPRPRWHAATSRRSPAGPRRAWMAHWRPRAATAHPRARSPRRQGDTTAPGSRTSSAPSPTATLRGPRPDRRRRAWRRSRWRATAHLQRHRHASRAWSRTEHRSRVRAATCVTVRDGSGSSNSTPTRTAPRSPASSGRCRRPARRPRRRCSAALNLKTRAAQGGCRRARPRTRAPRRARPRRRPRRARAQRPREQHRAAALVDRQLAGRGATAERRAPPSRSPRPRGSRSRGAKARALIVPAASSIQAQA